MSDPHRPNAALAAAIAASGLLIAAFSRGRPESARAPARVPARAPATRTPARREDAAAAPRSVWSVLKSTASEFSDDRLLTEAAGVTFYALLAIFPAIAALISVFGLFADPQTVQEHLDLAVGFIPGGGMEIIKEQVQRITEKPGGALGFGLIVGLATSLWSANAGMKALVDALSVVYDEPDSRGFFHRLFITMAFTLGALGLVLLALAALVVLPVALRIFGLQGPEGWIGLVRWPILLAAIGLYLALVYRWAPHRRTAQWRWITWGSATASVCWVLGSAGFSWYVANFGSYNETYGSLGAAIGFMTWIWLSATVVLLGAELDSVLEEQIG